MTPSPTPPLASRSEHGFTLVEMLVAMVTGVIVIIATLSVLDISISQSSRISERVDADQRARLAMEKILLELHSSCVTYGNNAVEPGSADTNIKFVSRTGSEAFFRTMTKHEISLSGGKLTDASYRSTNELNAKGEGSTTWSYPAIPTSTQTLLTGVSQSGTTHVFQYFKYVEGNLSTTALTTPLSEEDAANTAAVTVSFTTAPSSERITAHRTVDLTDTAVLRFDPASATGTNEPCA